ncbi:MAG TPA: response regulator transcription factor [Thermoleophilaceae bacterium]|jgi:DNA-binding NarL/FixJ family response regulator|nr:response regulator transcription factor [Thermoleophilaceae bacterium]
MSIARFGTDLGAPLAVYVACDDESAGAAVVQALEREGLNLAAECGPLAELESGSADDFQIIVVLESEDLAQASEPYNDLRASVPDAVIVVVCSPSRRRPQSLLWSGVDAIVVEPGADAVVGPTVRAALAGYLVLPRSLRAAVQPPPLTTRERQLLALVVEGLSNREIAERLYLAESTVKRHLSSIFRRLGVRSRREAVATMLATPRGDDD